MPHGRRRIPIACAALVCAVVANAETHLSGDIDGIAFEPGGGPYVVEKDIVVPEGKKVEVPAGCVFLFNAFSGLIVKGHIIVKGSPDNPVVFTSIHDSEYNPGSSQLPNPFDWNGILVTGTSVGSYFNDFSLRYSVYGIKSQSKNVVIQNGLFRQNGQFHFTVHDKIQFVQDNIPYSYGGAGEIAGDAPAQEKSAVSRKEKKTERTSGGTVARQTRIVRFSCLGVGIAGAGLGTFFVFRAKRHLDRIAQIDWEVREGVGTPSTAERSSEDDKRIQSVVGSAVSFSIGLLGFVGFGISFAF